MKRKTSHMESSEPFMEYILSILRFKEAVKYIKKGDIVADLGCGYNGKFLVYVYRRIKQGVGYDVSVSKKSPKSNIILKKADLNDNFANGRKFDKVTALAVLEHVESPMHFIKQARLLLKKNGRLILTTPQKSGKPFLEFLATLGIISKEEILDHKNYFDKQTLKKLLKTSGFRNVKVETFEMGFNLIAVAKK